MKKKQWYVFGAIFFLIAVVYYRWSTMPSVVYGWSVDSFSELAILIDNKIDRTIALISAILGFGCLICSICAEK